VVGPGWSGTGAWTSYALKIGVKPSDATTFRAHFHWDAAKRLVVLGHCGKHLDHD
jgi:hypothetical protein